MPAQALRPAVFRQQLRFLPELPHGNLVFGGMSGTSLCTLLRQSVLVPLVPSVIGLKVLI